MTKVKILSGIRHGGQQYYADELRVLDDELAGYFCNSGWAVKEGEQPVAPDLSPTTLTLDVKGSQHRNKAPQVGVK